MLRRWKHDCSIASILTLTVAVLFASIGCVKTPDAKKVESEFAVPDGDPAKILDFIKDLRAHSPEFNSREEAVERSRNVQQAMLEAGDKILAQKADDEQLRQGTTLKMIGTISQASMLDRDSPEFEKLAKNAMNVVSAARKDNRAPVKEVANQFWVAARAISFNFLSETERADLAKDAVENVKNLRVSQQAAGEAGFVADQFVAAGETDVAGSMYDQLAELLKKSSDQKTKSLAMTFYTKGRRLRLVGKPLQLEGKLLGGDLLNWDSYRGKVVLIDFWATWCGPCVADLPNVKAIYHKYHSQGFEVIGVSLDHSRRELEDFVKAESLPWPQLFDEQVQVAKKGPNPASVKYSVNSIPTAFLVDSDGKVVSIDAHAAELDAVLKKLLAAAAENAKSSADESATSP